MKKDKKSILLIGIGAITLLITFIGATYAYFAADLGGGTNANIKASTGTTDSLTFDAGDPIRIHASLENFAEGMENLKGSTTATATLKANNTTNEATSKYNIFFIIDDNDFVYSTEDGQAELILKVTDPNGKEVEDITGLKRVENGFDITTRTGGFLIRADYDINTTSTLTQTWNIEVTLVNLNSDQNINKGKTLNGRFYITTEQISTYEIAKINAIESETTYNKINANLNYTVGTSEIDKYYYAIEEDTSSVALLGFSNGILRTNSLAAKELNYIESEEPTHTFNNLKPNTSYKVYSYAKDIHGISSNLYETSITTDEYVLPKVTGLTHASELYKITVTATSEAGSNEVSKYYFSKDNGVTWSEGQVSPTYVFDNLLDTTTYNIKVRVSDTEDKYSTEYYEAIATSTYINPSITTVTNTKTYNSITLTATATKGSNEISKYYFSKDNGVSWSEGQASNFYTFTGLSENTTYNIKVKVEDTIGRISNVYSLEATTNIYKVPVINSVTAKTTYNSIQLTATTTPGDGTITKYYYSKDNGSNWTAAQTSNIYKFNNLTYTVTFNLKVKVEDSNGRESSVYSLTAKTDAPVLSTYIKDLYTTQGTNGIYYHTSSLANGAGDNSYRYAGENPNNYVCFGSTVSPCPTDSLYRIVGVYGDQVKLIKFDFAQDSLLGVDGDRRTGYAYNATAIENYKGSFPRPHSYYWNYKDGESSKNDWTVSRLNTVNLNTNFINNIGTNWNSLIASDTWYIGGISISNGLRSGAKTAYNYEVGANKTNTTYNAKIGLPYINEYYYAAPSNYWTTPGYTASSYPDSNGNYGASYDYRSAANDNWMDMQINTATITKSNWTEASAIRISGDRYGSWGTVYTSTAIRPTFKLNSSVLLSSGTGTKSNPYRIVAGTSTTKPTINSVTYSRTETSITLNVVGKAGANAIGTYYFSKDGGTTWIAATEYEHTSYKFSGLTSNTTYAFKIKLVDVNGVESSIYSTSITTYKNPTVSISSTSTTSSSITVNASATKGTNAISKYYFSKDGGSSWSTKTTTATTSSYTFTGLSSSTSYSIKVKVIDSGGKESTVVSKSVTTNASMTLAAKVKSLYTSQGSNGIYYHSSSLANGARDYSYRYAGTDPNNYICFGSTLSSCPSSNLYRIIGVFDDQVKLIKADPAEISEIGSIAQAEDFYFYWSGSGADDDNVWRRSTLNTEALNGEYLTYLGTTWTNKIAVTAWKVGGASVDDLDDTNARTAYDYEVGRYSSSTTYSAKIGLMYISDYYYAADKSYWTYAGNREPNYSEAKYYNWMRSGIWPGEWTITKYTDFYGVEQISTNGITGGTTADVAKIIRPTFYLNSSVTYSSGTGTYSNPFRIEI